MSSDGSSSLQDEFFQRARTNGEPLVVYLTSGKKLVGRLKAFDKFTILLEIGRVDQMIFKHAISTVAPSRGERQDEA